VEQNGFLGEMIRRASSLTRVQQRPPLHAPHYPQMCSEVNGPILAGVRLARRRAAPDLQAQNSWKFPSRSENIRLVQKKTRLCACLEICLSLLVICALCSEDGGHQYRLLRGTYDISIVLSTCGDTFELPIARGWR